MIEAATIVRSRDRAQPGRAGRDRPRHQHLRRHGHRLGSAHSRGPCTQPARAAETIFATHYHELTALDSERVAISAYRVDVLERGDDVVFLHAVVEGGADRAYGVHVARLAGVPERVTRRAALLLRELEAAPRREDSDSGENV